MRDAFYLDMVQDMTNGRILRPTNLHGFQDTLRKFLQEQPMEFLKICLSND